MRLNHRYWHKSVRLLVKKHTCKTLKEYRNKGIRDNCIHTTRFNWQIMAHFWQEQRHNEGTVLDNKVLQQCGPEVSSQDKRPHLRTD